MLLYNKGPTKQLAANIATHMPLPPAAAKHDQLLGSVPHALPAPSASLASWRLSRCVDHLAAPTLVSGGVGAAKATERVPPSAGLHTPRMPPNIPMPPAHALQGPPRLQQQPARQPPALLQTAAGQQPSSDEVPRPGVQPPMGQGRDVQFDGLDGKELHVVEDGYSRGLA